VGTPDAAAFWRIIEEYKVNLMYAAPTALRAIRKVDPMAEMIKKYDLSSFRRFYWAGERADPETVSFYSKVLSEHCGKEIPIVDCFWQTETGWTVCGVQDTLKKVLPGSTAKPLPGFDVCIVKDVEPDSDKAPSQLLKENELGMICIRNPLPPGALTTVHNNDERYLSSYMKAHPGYYATGDMGFCDHDGYITVMSRNDDLINVAGHRLSTGTLEQAISGHPDIAEVACVGARDTLKGEVCVGFIVLKGDATKQAAAVEKECVARVRDLVGPVASFHNCFTVTALPKTRSGKILRTIIRRIVNKEEKWIDKVPGTVEDVNVLYAIEEVVKKRFKPQ
jgi:propionyl-CoA synthetase